MSTAPATVNIDLRPEVSFQAYAVALADEKGKPFLKPQDPSRWNAALRRLVGKGRIRIEVWREKGPRSDQQNKYLWTVVYQDYLNGWKQLAAEAGIECPFRDKDDVHYYWKHKLIGQEVRRYGSEEFVLEPSTTRLSIEQFSNYVSLIMAEAAQRGIYIRAAGEE